MQSIRNFFIQPVYSLTMRFSGKIYARFVAVLWLTASLAAQTASLQTAEPSQSPSPANQEQVSALTDAREIIRRSVTADQQNWLKARKYTWQERRLYKHLDKHGDEKSQELKTFDTTFLYDQQYSRLVEIDDKPLNEKEQAKEEEKQEKFIAKYRNESEEERQKRLAKNEKEREEQRAFTRDIVNAYDFQLIGEEQLRGRDTYVIQAIPRKDFHPTQPHADLLTKIQGKLWIDKQEYRWIKMEAEVVDTMSFGLFLARVHKGSRISIEWTRVNDEVWLPLHLYLNASARLVMIANEGFEQQSDFSKFRKFTTDSKILPGLQEVVEPQPAATP